jgi:uncharacterized protein YndB with AHSA1/START domain
MMATSHGDGETVVQIRRTLPCPPEDAYQAWTDPELVPQWFKPPDGTGGRAEMDVRVGGTYRWAMERGGRVAYVVGEYLEVSPPSRLVFTFGWEAMPGVELRDSVVTVEFNDRGDEVELVITHARIPDAELREQHGDGWREMLANLEQTLASRKPRDAK